MAVVDRRFPKLLPLPASHPWLGWQLTGSSKAPAIAKELVVTDAAVAKHVNRIVAKLDLGADDTAHKRVQAVLTYLRQ
ncbi:hypothetical protein [Micromonospora echinospora]|uniref:hypothetical protein n=1 Tax=Micromonospora echinospora TaxID=1877 RepID=UPI00366DA2DD